MPASAVLADANSVAGVGLSIAESAVGDEPELLAAAGTASAESAVGDEPGLKSWAALKADRNGPCEYCEMYLRL